MIFYCSNPTLNISIYNCEGKKQNTKAEFSRSNGSEGSVILFKLLFLHFNTIRYYLPGWIFTEHINKHVRGINIIIVRVTTDGASSPGVCRHRRWPSVANWQTRLVIVMNIIHKVNIMSAASPPLPGRARLREFSVSEKIIANVILQLGSLRMALSFSSISEQRVHQF